MPTSPYSKDLRKKVIEYIKKGNSQKDASEVFGLHKNTVNRWSIRYLREGHYGARPRLGNRSRVDYKAMELFVSNKPDIKLSEVGSKFGISGWHAGRILKKLGFSYKKKPSHMWKQMKKNEQGT